MITEKFIEFLLLGFLTLITTIVPAIDFVIPDGVLHGFSRIFYGVGWFLPLSGLGPILSFSLVVSTFKIVVAIARFVMRFIPGADGS